MSQIRRYSTIFFILTLVIFNIFSSVKAYDDFAGIEYDDIVDVAFESYRNGELVIEYTPDGPLRVEVNTNAVNYHFVNELLGMKVGEKKYYITWTVDSDLIEYYNTTILKIVKDATPTANPIWRIIKPILIVLAVLGGIVGAIYIAPKIKSRIVIKKCTNCNKPSKSKCAKCGYYYCEECSSKGCTNCGSRKFIRLQN